MRRLFLLSLFVLSVFAVQAQPKWGTWSVVPHVGVSFANLTNDAIHVADNRISHSQTRIGFSGGADVYYQLTDKLALSGGVAYTQAGCNFKDIPADLSARSGTVFHDSYFNLGYVDVPLLAHVYVSKGLSFSVGCQPSFLTKATAHAEMQDYETDGKGGIKYDKNVVSKGDAKSLFKKTAFAIPVGVSYEYENVMLTARYNIGLTKVYDHEIGDSKNKIITVSVGYKFNL
ncbi:PorT family protein [Prevotella intermedia]|uniref:Membrane protein n=1 Tax=Prevotella intermedia ZT TaxID=1347790 RepID=A0AAP0VBT7_PREIN|nr:porin family protein [Prevotella intermedia]ATV32486.1 PorT family protein [Prevotella intermedia]ATV41103.1 PorT family protein [Prevotella intermedia]KJJ87939.1 membrane protein [Prevotella intermedia ZT]